VFVSTGSLLYYIMTGRLAFSLLLAAPWMMQRVMYGWGRSYLLGHFFGLMAMYFIRARAAGSRLKAKQVVMIGFGVLVVLCMFPFLGMMRGMKQQLGLNASSFSGDLVRMTMTQTDPLDMMQTYLGTNSAISGFEPSYYHLTVDTRPKWGTVYLYQYIFQPIPRVLFPGKGDGYSWARDLLGVDVDPRVIAIGMAPGAVGGAFEEWGWIGIPAEFLFTGWLIGWAEKRARRKPRLPYVQVGYAGLYSMMQAMGRSPLLNWIAQRWAFGYGIPVVILWLVHRRAMERARTGRQRTARSVGSPMTASGSTA